MKRSFSVNRVVFHPSTLAVFSGFLGAIIGFLLNLAAGGNTSQLLWLALIFAILFSLSITAWQMYQQEQTGKQWMTMLQEMVFQTYFLTLVADKPEISQLAQQRLGQVMKTLAGEQQVSMLKFFSHNGLSATFIGDALQGSSGLIGADLQQIALPQIHLEEANLSRVNFRNANLKDANLNAAILHYADLSSANLSQTSLTRADLRGINLHEANLTGANLNAANLGSEKGERASRSPDAGRKLQRYLRANLTNATLSHAHLQGANLMGADLSGANLQGANLTQAVLYEAILDGANLQGANLTGANLYKAILNGANLQGADLTQAVLYGATLDGADVRTAKVTEEQFQTVVSSKNVKREP